MIVTDGAAGVDARGGDDLVCVTGDASAVPEESRTVVVLAGAGNDLVDATTPGWGTITILGAGADTYLGTSDAGQEVRTSEGLDTPDVQLDTVKVTSGIATVDSGAEAQTNADVVAIDSGIVEWTGVVAPGRTAHGWPGQPVADPTHARATA